MANEKKPIKGNIQAIVIGVIMVVLGAVTIRLYFVDGDFLQNELPNWQESTAVITAAELLDYDSSYGVSESSYRIRFTYDFYFYNDQGEKIELTRITEGTGSYTLSEEQRKPAYNIGDEVPISYDPENYEDYYFDTKEALNESMSQSYEILLGLALGVPGLALIVYNIVRIIMKNKSA
jgi:hypothetical protein